MKKLIIILAVFLSACSEDGSVEEVNSPNLIIKLKFDKNQERLNNLGELESVASGNAAQSLNVERMSANYIEFAQTATTALGSGEIIYKGLETNSGGDLAIDVQQAKYAGDNEVFLRIPLSAVSAGTYQWTRVSLAYQEANINVFVNGVEYEGTLASFVGYNNYITSFNLNDSDFNINSNKTQGFWAFEAEGFTSQGQAPEGATTVPNPLFNSSPIPQGSCVVTGQFENDLVITGNETEDVTVVLSFSTNNSFEWTEVNADGNYEPNAGEQVVDMGLRGLIPYQE